MAMRAAVVDPVGRNACWSLKSSESYTASGLQDTRSFWRRRQARVFCWGLMWLILGVKGDGDYLEVPMWLWRLLSLAKRSEVAVETLDIGLRCVICT